MFKRQFRIIFYIFAVIVSNKIENKNLFAMSCMPRISLSIGGRPFFWNIFGKDNVDKDIDETSREIDENSPGYEKLNWSTVSD